MKTWKEFLDEAYAELGPIGEPPPQLYFWYAYRGGKCVGTADSKEEAEKLSPLVERVFFNEAEVMAWRKARDKACALAVDNWYAALRAQHADVSDKMFELCYSEAYDRAHSGGHDEVAETLKDVIEFARKLLKP